MDLNKNVIFIKNFTPKKRNKNNSILNQINEKKSPPNKIRLVMNKNNLKNNNPNKLILKNNSNDKIIKTEKNNSIRMDTNLFLNKINSLNEITLNSLAQENNFLKKEIEIVKSSLILSDEKEQLHKDTIQRIKKLNQENEISYISSIGLVNEYKKREIDYKNKIIEMENNFNKKQEELNIELSIFKKDLFNKNKIINDLNNKISDLNQEIIRLKKIIKEKNNIIVFLSRKNANSEIMHIKNSNYMHNLNISKSCNNLIPKKNGFQTTKTEKNVKKIKYINSFKNLEIIKFDDKVTHKTNITLNNENNLSNHDRINSYYKKIINEKTYTNKNKNSLNVYSLKNNYLNKSFNKNLLNFKKSLKKDKNDRNINNSFKQIYMKRNIIKTSPEIQRTKMNNIIEFNNYCFLLNDSEKNRNELIRNNKKLNNCNIIARQISKKKLKLGNIKGIYSKNNNLIEINKYYTNKNSSFISSLSLGNISLKSQNK